MKILALILSIVFIILTFAGACYVLSSGGEVSAGYACIPMALTLISLALYRKYE